MFAHAGTARPATPVPAAGAGQSQPGYSVSRPIMSALPPTLVVPRAVSAPLILTLGMASFSRLATRRRAPDALPVPEDAPDDTRKILSLSRVTRTMAAPEPASYVRTSVSPRLRLLCQALFQFARMALLPNSAASNARVCCMASRPVRNSVVDATKAPATSAPTRARAPTAAARAKPGRSLEIHRVNMRCSLTSDYEWRRTHAVNPRVPRSAAAI